jgi:HK97 family phage portal protein
MNIFDYLGNVIKNGSSYFYKKNTYYGSSYMLGSKGATFVDVQKPNELYNTIPQVKTVIDRKALMFANMELKLVNKSDGTEVEDVDFSNLINNPNPLQSMNDWLRQFKQQEQVYGNQFIYKNTPSALSKYPTSLQNISPRYLAPYLTGKVFDQTTIEGIIAYYEYYLEGSSTSKRKFDVNEILYSRLNDIDNPIIGVSPIFYLIYPISNTKLAYEYRNVIMGEKGAIGILSNESKDSMGGIPLKKEERKRIEDSYTNEYGVGAGQRRIHLTEASLKWQPMTYPTKDLLLFEEIDANLNTIVDAFGLNINIFSSKNATFENVKNSLIQCYQDTIIPEADQFAQSLTNFIVKDKTKEIRASYEHVAILKESEAEESAELKTKIDSVTQLVNANIITPIQAQSMMASLNADLVIDTSTNQPSIVDKLGTVSPLLATQMLKTLTQNEIRSLIGLPAVVGGDSIAPTTNTNFQA